MHPQLGCKSQLNSGVVDFSFYYKPEYFKAKFCSESALQELIFIIEEV
jgi:hypothetical protein